MDKITNGIKPFFKREHFTFLRKGTLLFLYIKSYVREYLNISFSNSSAPNSFFLRQNTQVIIIIFSHNFFQTSPHFLFLWIPQLTSFFLRSSAKEDDRIPELTFFLRSPAKNDDRIPELTFFLRSPAKKDDRIPEITFFLSFFGPPPKMMIEFRSSLSFFLFLVPRQK